MKRKHLFSVSAVLSAVSFALSAMVLVLSVMLMTGVVVSCNAGGDDDDGVGTGKVYVCTSSGSKVWHCRKSCSALKKCGGSIRETTLGSLGSQYKKPCGVCYK